jgi:hypothetical protein
LRTLRAILALLLLSALTAAPPVVVATGSHPADCDKLNEKLQKALQDTLSGPQSEAKPGRWPDWEGRKQRLRAACLRLYSAIPQDAKTAIWSGDDVYLDTQSAEQEWLVAGKMADQLISSAEIPLSGRDGRPIGISVMFHRQSGRNLADHNQERLAIEANVRVRLSDAGDVTDIVTLADDTVAATDQDVDPRNLLAATRSAYERKADLDLDDAAPLGLLNDTQLEDVADASRKGSPDFWLHPWVTPVMRFYVRLSSLERRQARGEGLVFSKLAPEKQATLLAALAEIGRRSIPAKRPAWRASNPKSPTVGIYESGRRLDKQVTGPLLRDIRIGKPAVWEEFTTSMARQGYSGMFAWIEASTIEKAWRNARKRDPKITKAELMRDRDQTYPVTIALVSGEKLYDGIRTGTKASYELILRAKRDAAGARGVSTLSKTGKKRR